MRENIIIATNPESINFNSGEYIVVTHSGIFHAHEVCACVLAEPDIIVRTRNTEMLQAAEKAAEKGAPVFIIDIGGKTNFHVLDHHHYQGFRNLDGMFFGLPTDEAQLRLLKSVAKLDCGEDDIDIISSKISEFNPQWNEDCSDKAYSDAFKKAMEFASVALLNAEVFINSAIRKTTIENGKVEANNFVKKFYNESALPEEFLVMEKFVPWQDTVCGDHEFNRVRFVIFPDLKDGWRVQVVPKSPTSFEAKVPLPAEWAGKRGKDLADLTKISGAIFCHPGRFIAGFETRNEAILAARKAWEAHFTRELAKEE